MPRCDTRARVGPYGGAWLLAGAIALTSCSNDHPAQQPAAAAGTGGSGLDDGTAGPSAGVAAAGATAGSGGPGATAGGGGTAGSGGPSNAGDAGGSTPTGGSGSGAGSGGGGTGGAVAGGGSDADACAAQGPGCAWLCEGGDCQCDCTPVSSCVVAQDLTSCCATYRPASDRDLRADECLVPYPEVVEDLALLQRCAARSPVSCAVVQCELPQPPPSRLAVADGMGGCRYDDECQSDGDCVRGVYSTDCCTCGGTSLPRALVESDPCIVRTNDGIPAECPRCKIGALCVQCPASVPAPICVVQDPANACR